MLSSPTSTNGVPDLLDEVEGRLAEVACLVDRDLVRLSLEETVLEVVRAREPRGTAVVVGVGGLEEPLAVVDLEKQLLGPDRVDRCETGGPQLSTP